jgi:hypothetical protein
MCCHTDNIISRIFALNLVCQIVCHYKCGRFWPSEPKSGGKSEPWVLEAQRFEACQDRLLWRCFFWPMGLAFLNISTCSLCSIDLLYLCSSRLRSVVGTKRTGRPNLLYISMMSKRIRKVTWSFFFHKEIAPSGPGPPHCRRFTITFRHNALVRIPLDEWSTRRRDLYLTTHTIPKIQISMSPAGFEPAIPARDRPQNPRPLGSAVVSDSGRELYAGTGKESCVDGNIKATYRSESYLARKLNHLLRCIGKKSEKFPNKINRTDDCLHYSWLQNCPQSYRIPMTTITKNVQSRVPENTVYRGKEYPLPPPHPPPQYEHEQSGRSKVPCSHNREYGLYWKDV